MPKDAKTRVKVRQVKKASSQQLTSSFGKAQNTIDTWKENRINLEPR